jgi:hypothetical protein
VTRRRSTPQEPLWQGLAFTPKPPTGSDAAGPAPATTAPKRRRTKPVVPLIGNDEFLKTLPGAPRDGSGTRVDVPTARRSRLLSGGEHGNHKAGGVGFGISSSKLGSQAAYQHPGCPTGDCVPVGLPCLCPCTVCHPYRPSE